MSARIPPGGRSSYSIAGDTEDMLVNGSSASMSGYRRTSSINPYADEGPSQNTGNRISDRSSIRVRVPPGGQSSFSIGYDEDEEESKRRSSNSYASGSNPITGNYEPNVSSARGKRHSGGQSSWSMANGGDASNTYQTSNQSYGAPKSGQPPQQRSNMDSYGSGVSSNVYATGANQNCGNVITDRRTVRVINQPGGKSNWSIGDAGGGSGDSVYATSNSSYGNLPPSGRSTGCSSRSENSYAAESKYPRMPSAGDHKPGGVASSSFSSNFMSDGSNYMPPEMASRGAASDYKGGDGGRGGGIAGFGSLGNSSGVSAPGGGTSSARYAARYKNGGGSWSIADAGGAGGDGDSGPYGSRAPSGSESGAYGSGRRNYGSKEDDEDEEGRPPLRRTSSRGSNGSGGGSRGSNRGSNSAFTSAAHSLVGRGGSGDSHVPGLENHYNSRGAKGQGGYFNSDGPSHTSTKVSAPPGGHSSMVIG